MMEQSNAPVRDSATLLYQTAGKTAQVAVGSHKRQSDQQTYIPGGWLVTQLTTLYTQQTRMRWLIASLSVTEMDWYGEFILGSLEEQKGGVNHG